MHWQSILFRLPRDHADTFGDGLMELGAISVNVDDALDGTADEVPIFGEPGADTGLWNECRLTALFPADLDVPKVFELVANAMQISRPAFDAAILEDQDWVERNREQFQPIKISTRIWIVPTWHRPPQHDAINIVLDPGAAFGTGSHPTTRLCLNWLEENITAEIGQTVIDYGTGSGILAISAMKLGAIAAYGVDIDQRAVETARFNAAQNDVLISFADVNSKLCAVGDVLIANILANPLRILAPLLAAHTKPGGSLVLAGILDEQADEIIGLYRQWFDLRVWRSEEGWACLAGKRGAA